MRKSAVHWIVLTAVPLAIFACGDDDSTTTTGAAGSAGSKAGSGGKAGSGNGGSGGSGGSAQGGNGGSGGGSGGATGGSAGSAGSGGKAGSAGSAGAGGSGGSAGGGGSAGSGGGTADAGDAKAPDGGGDGSTSACVANTGTNPSISNMEGAKAVVSATDGRTANDVGNLNPTYTTVFAQELESDGGTNHVLHVKGAIPGTGYLSHETGFNLTTAMAPLCYDASAYDGISFKIRGTSDNAAPNGLPANMLRVYVLNKATRPSTATPPGLCTPPEGGANCGIPSKDIALTGTMTEVKVKWTDLAIPSYLYDPGVPKTDYGKTIYAIQLDVFGAGGAPLPDAATPPTVNFEYWIDDVAFLPKSD
jgi:hypothetical protein